MMLSKMTNFQVVVMVVGYVVVVTMIVWNIMMRDNDFPKENDR